MKMNYNKVDFADFLNYFDFSYRYNNDKTFSLVDLQQANLSNIEEDTFSTDIFGMTKCIERLDTYIYDYTIRFLNENTNFNFYTISSALSFSESSYEYQNIVKEWCNLDILNAVIHPDFILLQK